MWGKIQKLLDRVEARIALWQIIQGSGILGAATLTAVLSGTVSWIAQYGAFGWWVSFLCGCVLAAAACSLFALFRLRLVQARATAEWKDAVTSVNPLDKEFHKIRVDLNDLKPPYEPFIRGKRFIDCEIIFRSNLMIRDHVHFTNMAFIGCDVIVYHPPQRINNITYVGSCEFVGGKLIGATIYIDPTLVSEFKKMGANFVALTGDEEIDSRLLQGTGSGTQP